MSFFAKMMGAVALSCLLSSPVAAQEVGEHARTCMEDVAPSDEVQAGLCFEQEARDWGQRVSAAEAALAADGVAADVLVDARRAFIAYRHALCVDEGAARQSVAGSGAQRAECVMETTAAQALELEQILEERQ